MALAAENNGQASWRGDSGCKKKEGVKREGKAQKLTKVIRERGREETERERGRSTDPVTEENKEGENKNAESQSRPTAGNWRGFGNSHETMVPETARFLRTVPREESLHHMLKIFSQNLTD